MTIQLSEPFGGCDCSAGKQQCDCIVPRCACQVSDFNCNQGRNCPTREQIKPLGILDMTLRESLLYAVFVVVAIAGFSLFPWSVA